MKKRIPLFVFACFLAGGFSAFAMPPHPLNKNPTGRERQDPTIGSREPLYKSLMRKGPSDGRARAPFSGTITMRVLVLLVNFSDTPMASGSTPAFYKDLLETGPGLTMREYYQDMSQNNLNLEFTAEGPYTVGKSLAYYGANNASGRDAHPVELVRDVLQLFTADKGAGYPYSDYDNNNDEFVDGIFVIHAGKGEEFGGGPDTIWSHQLSLGAFEEGFVTAPDGITKFNTYTIEPEYNRLPGDATIGVFCHEFGHVLGLPDLYDVNYETAGVGMWSLMSTGSWGSGQARQDGKDPAPFLAWERYFLGGEDWVTLEELGSSAQNVSIDDIEAAPRKAYKIYLNSPGQFLILEGKKKVFDIVTPLPFVPADGILITQIHDGLITSKRLSNTVATGLNRVHGINILEANTPHDEAGRGHLWLTLDPDYTNKYPNTPFSSETRDNLGGSRGIGARGPLFPSGFPSSAWPVCAAAVFFFFLGKARKKCVFPALAVTLALSAFLLTCSLDGSDDDNGAGGGYKLVSYPNSNYYLSEDIYSKTGISGVTLSNISSRASFPMTFDLKLE